MTYENYGGASRTHCQPEFGTRSEEKKIFEQSVVQVFRASNLNVNIVVNDETALHQDKLNVTTTATQAVDVDCQFSWKRNKAKIEDYQLKDHSFGLLLKQLEHLGSPFEPRYNNLGANQIKREEALKYGVEFVGCRSQGEQLGISNGVCIENGNQSIAILSIDRLLYQRRYDKNFYNTFTVLR